MASSFAISRTTQVRVAPFKAVPMMVVGNVPRSAPAFPRWEPWVGCGTSRVEIQFNSTRTGGTEASTWTGSPERAPAGLELLARERGGDGVRSEGHGVLGDVVTHDLHRHVQHVLGRRAAAVGAPDLAACLGERRRSGPRDLAQNPQVDGEEALTNRRGAERRRFGEEEARSDENSCCGQDA